MQGRNTAQVAERSKPVSKHYSEILETEQMVGKDRIWAVRCAYCDAQLNRTHTQITKDWRRCDCRARATVSLTVDDVTLTIREWKDLHPDINIGRVRNYLSQRNRGLNSLTDEEILFGKKKAGSRRNKSAADKHLAKDAKRHMANIHASLAHSMSEAGKRWIDRYLDHYLRSVTQANLEAFAPAGDSYTIGMMDATILELVLEEMPTSDIVAFLQTETYADLDEKREKLQHFIPVDESVPTQLTPLEIMALLSSASLTEVMS